MSIYTITLKRELLSGSNTIATNSLGQPNSNINNSSNKQSNWREKGKEEGSSERLIAFQEKEEENNEKARGENSSSHNIIDEGKEVEARSETRDKKKIEEEEEEQIDRLLDCICSKKVVKVEEGRGLDQEGDKENRLRGGK